MNSNSAKAECAQVAEDQYSKIELSCYELYLLARIQGLRCLEQIPIVILDVIFGVVIWFQDMLVYSNEKNYTYNLYFYKCRMCKYY